MRTARFAMPSPADLLRAPGYSPAALAAREHFLRDMAGTYAAAGDARTAALLERDADAQRVRHQANRES